jgi:hypothetical protein
MGKDEGTCVELNVGDTVVDASVGVDVGDPVGTKVDDRDGGRRDYQWGGVQALAFECRRL